MDVTSFSLLLDRRRRSVLDRVVVAKHSAIYRLAAIDLQNPMTHSLFSMLPTYISVHADVAAERANRHICGH